MFLVKTIELVYGLEILNGWWIRFAVSAARSSSHSITWTELLIEANSDSRSLQIPRITR